MKIVSWKIKLDGNQEKAWQVLREMNADVALLQEVRKPPAGVGDWAELDPEPWRIAGHTDKWRTAIARLSDRFEVDWIPAVSIPEAGPRDFSVSRPGSIVAASVKRESQAPLVVVSMYSVWERKAQIASANSKIMAVSSAHRMISDLSRLVGGNTHLVAAGDLNVWNIRGEPAPFKHLEGGGANYQTVFDRMAAIGVPFVGPHGPEAGRQPEYADSREAANVVTFQLAGNPSGATREQQLDFVFATKKVRPLSVRALNEPHEWGPSDHCRILIEIDE